MFDLRYYNNEKKQEVWIDELKSKYLTKQYVSNIRKDKNTLRREIGKLPDFVDFKTEADILYAKFGQRGLEELRKHNEKIQIEK